MSDPEQGRPIVVNVTMAGYTPPEVAPASQAGLASSVCLCGSEGGGGTGGGCACGSKTGSGSLKVL